MLGSLARTAASRRLCASYVLKLDGMMSLFGVSSETARTVSQMGAVERKQEQILGRIEVDEFVESWDPEEWDLK